MTPLHDFHLPYEWGIDLHRTMAQPGRQTLNFLSFMISILKGMDAMRRLSIPALIVLLFMGCSGSGGSDPQTPPPTSTTPIPAAATAMDSTLTSDTDKLTSQVAKFDGILVGIFSPGTPLAPGVVLSPDPSPGAPPHSFTFSGPYDSNGDGMNDTTISGQATFNTDPSDFAWSSVTGQAVVDVDIPIVGQLFHADVNFSITSTERRLSGSGTFTNVFTGNITTMTVAAARPLVVKPATGAAGAVSNACSYSLNGQMFLEVIGSSGTLTSTWNFSSNNTGVAVNNKTFTDSSGQTTLLPDATVFMPCGASGTINDWVGTYDQHWACLPLEFGQATITISVTGPNTVEIMDSDPPGSLPVTYTATTIGGNPHALHGSFISGPAGFRYREDFYWTMRKGLPGFRQSSSYVFFEGPNTGKGGLCVASAPRL